MNIGIKPKLDICIPTFQRPHECVRQVVFLYEEIKCLLSNDDCAFEINLYIRDNHSDNKNYLYIVHEVEKIKQGFDSFLISINRNNANLGLVGNIQKMLQEDSLGDYVWFVGDDDILHQGVLNNIINGLSGEKKDLIFMNYNCIHKDFGLVKAKAFSEKENFNILELFNKNDAIMMFITSCVYSREMLLSAFSFHEKNHGPVEITFPLYSAFYCSFNGIVKIIPEIFISDVVSGISWESVYNRVRLILVPREILKLKVIGYSTCKTYLCVINYYVKNYRYIIGVFLRLFVPSKIVNKISRYLKAAP
ncbi:glycosyltransferase [Aeromonas veronii]|uniref:glycosyltransferase n=1 Tax=Aeromonas veronii TaxID=654 RepID=UPI003BA2D511